jgi:tripartite-type tricarboxylate transporter receptor subunit TctC
VVPLIQAGQLDALAVSSLRRDEALPNIPTTLEAGYPNSEYTFWIGVLAPAATPKDIVQRLHDEIARALSDPAMRQRLKALGADPMPFTPAEFEAFLKAETESNAVVIKAAGIAPN